ncbi:hypothetical protein DICPUDRAFT_92151 [Dictyostelium purpureum]|uniref:Uncharacterized protein n=1 Tax=Dictyostelium purpureum TaxID=5786 RepID=F0ZMT5_DICPU|nr:uncharacterized protein DICPUDRAFT_92151 [Dictyostelium purpureum]EGC34739.1 hypothetical protein DICPUDRAFT_92151 [Dictyostelium purpureum]|eukprot:XP_003288739.1 hypothetical protein DICPUDRAFT_92151 [Dictyostelium purpureum]
MALKQSDIDICLVNDKPNKKFLFIVSSILRKNNYENIITLSHTRIPLIKLFDPEYNINIDLCLNNLLAIENSKLIKSYSSIDPRFQVLYMLIKAWAKAKEINDAADESLSSYSYANLVIFYLQTCTPPVLPCLHKNTESLPKRTVENSVVAFHQDPKALGFVTKNTLTVGELFYDFLCFYSTFDFKRYAICINKGHMVELKNCQKELLVAPACIYIQDPFIFDFNPGKSMTEKNFTKLLTEINKTIYIISNGIKDYGFDQIFSEPSLLSLSSNVKQHNLTLILDNNDGAMDNNNNIDNSNINNNEKLDKKKN